MRHLLYLILLYLILALCLSSVCLAGEPALDQVLDRIEKRYAPVGFTARFTQRSTIKAMDIIDTASGTIQVKRPGKMRWVYETPEPQTIVTDGRMLWIYHPEDNQVMVGAAPEFFAGGKGAGFLSDMKQMRSDFDISMAPPAKDGRWKLKLIPRRQGLGVSRIDVWVSPEDDTVEQILTVNAYGDETRISLSGIVFENEMKDADFVFAIPEGAEILQLDQ